MNYFTFVRRHAGFLLFGFGMMGLSNFGQTFFISLHSADIKAAFGLTNTSFGALYSAMTLLSALTLLYSGRWIDQWRLSRFTLLTFLGFGLGCLLMGVATHVVWLGLALFLLRHFGQGLSAHTGMTAISRGFPEHRGRAVAFIGLGYATTEGLFPLALIAMLAWVGWQESWLLAGGFLLLVAMPLQIYLSGFEPKISDVQMQAANGSLAVGRGEVLRDVRFYMLLPLYTSSPFLLTGLFFHQVQLAEAFGWSLVSLASAFVFYALTKIVTSLVVGPLVDRYTSLRVFPLVFLPLSLGLCVLVVPRTWLQDFAPFVYLFFIGVNLGMTAPVSGALWPELFGAKNLGAIRSMTASIMIFATAAAPVTFGAVLDMGIGFEQIAVACIFYLVGCAGLAFLASRITLSAR
jgi:MFS family permease